MGDDGGEEPDACDECLEGCVGYVMNNYGYTQDAAMEWCSTTPDSSYGCADTCMDDMGDDGGEDGPPECILDCPEIQPLADFLDNGVGDMTYDDVCEIFISWDGNTCTED